MPHASFAQLLQRFLNQLDTEGLTLEDDLMVTTLLSRLRRDIPKLQQSFNQVKGSADTSELAKLDKKRDQAYQLLLGALSLYRFETDAKKVAYDKLSHLFSSYKGISSADYERETSLLAQLIEHLRHEDYKTEVKLLELTPYVNRLANSQSDFEAVFRRRATVNSQKESSQTKSLRQQLLKAYSQLGQYLLLKSEVLKDSQAQKALTIYNAGRKYVADQKTRQQSKKDVKPTTTDKKTPETSSGADE